MPNYIDHAIEKSETLKRKFDADDVIQDPYLHVAAIEYLQEYKGSFDFMVKMQEELMKNKDITTGQAKGVLNCLIAEHRRNKEVLGGGSNPTEPIVQVVPDGTYTIVFDEPWNYRTLKLKTTKYTDQPAGTQMALYMSGSDNEHSFTGFAFVQGKKYYIWSGHKGCTELEESLRLLLNHDDPSTMGKAYALASGRCYRCNRKLTVPASLYEGLGPICAGVF